MLKTLAFLLTLHCVPDAPRSPLPEVHVDLIEVNHRYDDKLNHIFTQVIVYYEHPNGRFRPYGWDILQRGWQYPVFYKNRWEMRQGHQRIVARLYRVSHTTYDPERDARLEYWKGGFAPNILNRYQELPPPIMPE